MSHHDKTIEDKAKEAFLAGETIAAIAQRYELSRRTIERWAKAGVDGVTWHELRDRQKTNVVSITKPKPKTIPTSAPSVRAKRQPRELDELQIVELAIADLSAAMCTASNREEIEGKGIDVRSLGGLAGGLVKLLEYRRKVSPPTAAELAELAIAMGYTPEIFMQALHDEWRKQA